MRARVVISIVALALMLNFALPGRALAGDGLAELLWSKQELAGNPAEKKGGPRETPDFSGPSGELEPKPLPRLAAGLEGSLRRVSTPKKLVALTFDLCELTDMRAGYDGAVVDYLRENQVKATFFAGGRWMRSHPERAMQLMADPLFEIGNHAWTHGNFGILDERQMNEQVLWTQRQYAVLREKRAGLAKAKGLPPALAESVPAQPVLFRFPYGRCRPPALALLAKLGLAAVQWDVNSMDADKNRSGEVIAKTIISRVRPGSIILCHANGFGWHTAEALPVFVAELRRAGYEFVSASELMRSGNPEVKSECYADNPGDTAIYDKQFGDGVMHSWSRPQAGSQ